MAKPNIVGKKNESISQNTWIRSILGKYVTITFLDGTTMYGKFRQADQYSIIIHDKELDKYELVYKHAIKSIYCEEVDGREIINEILQNRKVSRTLPDYKPSDKRTEQSKEQLQTGPIIIAKPKRKIFTPE